MLHLVMHTVNNLPMHRLSETCFFSPNDLLSAGGRIALNETFPSPFDPDQGSTPKLIQAIELMEQRASGIRTAAFAFFLLYLVTIIYVRLDFSITRDETAESKMKVQ